MYFIWISTASFVALSTRGVKNVFQFPLMAIQNQLQHRFIKSLVLQLDRIGHSEKKTKVVSIEHK